MNDKNIINQRISLVRQALKTKGVDAIIVPTADPHLSEYLPEYWQAREWLSGFTGSAGTLVVTADEAYLWADSRYWVQAEAELAGTDISLQKLQSGIKTHVQWLADNIPVGGCVEINGSMLSVVEKDKIVTAFASNNISLMTTDDTAVDEVWGNTFKDRPALPKAAVYRHKAEFVDTTAAQKLAKVRAQLAEIGANYHIVSSVDDIAWLTNLRGADVDYNPIFLAHFLIEPTKATLFIDQSKLNQDIKNELAEAGIGVADYNDIEQAVSQIPTDACLCIDANKVAVSTLACLQDGVNIINQTAPSTLLKSRKSRADIEHIKEAMRQDGAALCQFFAEFERKLASGERLSELDVDTMLIEVRSKQPHYVSPSFPTIAGYNANGALPHYRATPNSFSYLDGSGLLLIDSGAQYHNGTTDITRVVPIGSDITDEHKRDFTTVLKAHIALAQAHFPNGIGAPLLDAICRAPMWAQQMDYGHGTGHGVGYFLNVHEGPQSIGYPTPVTKDRAMKAGMITSNEPGLYREGQWGIRIENLVANVAVDTPQETDFGDYLKFETVTLCPIDTRLVDKALLTAEEVNWLNNYHSSVLSELKNRVDGEALAWLIERTEHI